MSFEIENGILKYYRREANAAIVSIPDTVQEIGTRAIANESRLISIIIPDSVRKIGHYSFSFCRNLINIQVSEGNPLFSDIDGVLYDKRKQKLLCCPAGRENIHLPSSVKQIKNTEAFASCERLKEITVEPNHSTYTVLNGVLYEHEDNIPIKLIRCPVNISEIHIPETVREIYPHAFEYCKELEEITIPEQVTEIKEWTFKECYKLKHLHLPSGMKCIGHYAFYCCDNLRELILPEGVESVGDEGIFFQYSTEKIVIPESVKSIGKIFVPIHYFPTRSRPIHYSRSQSVTCHGIDIPVNNRKEISAMIYMIIRKDFDLEITLEIKYTILWQMFLKHPEDQNIRKYVQDHLSEIIRILIQVDQWETAKNYLETFGEVLPTQELDEFIRFAIEQHQYEIQLFLTDLKYQRNDFTPKDWNL